MNGIWSEFAEEGLKAQMEEEKFIFEDQHAMRLTHYVMAERLMQVEAYKIIEEWKANGTHETLAFILEQKRLARKAALEARQRR